MFQSIGMGEMLVIGILALVVLGPQDLLTSFRTAGKWVGRMQKMAREFSKAMNDAADQAGVGEINKTLKSATNPAKMGTDALKDAAGLGPETRKLAEKKSSDAKEWAEKARTARDKRAEEAAAAAQAAADAEAEMDDDLADAADDSTPAAPPAPAPKPASKPSAKAPGAGAPEADAPDDAAGDAPDDAPDKARTT